MLGCSAGLQQHRGFSPGKARALRAPRLDTTQPGLIPVRIPQGPKVHQVLRHTGRSPPPGLGSANQSNCFSKARAEHSTPSAMGDGGSPPEPPLLLGEGTPTSCRALANSMPQSTCRQHLQCVSLRQKLFHRLCFIKSGLFPPSNTSTEQAASTGYGTRCLPLIHAQHRPLPSQGSRIPFPPAPQRPQAGSLPTSSTCPSALKSLPPPAPEPCSSELCGASQGSGLLRPHLSQPAGG